MRKPAPKKTPAPELVWHGKHLRQLSLQASSTSEVVELLPPGSNGTGWRNRLIQGDNLAALKGLARTLAGQVDVIYIDPPFGTGGDFEYRAEIGGRKKSAQAAVHLPSTAYADSWGDQSTWFTMMAERLEVARKLLAEHGTLYVHVDWNVGHHLRPLLDEIFGAENSLGEVIWAYGSPSGGRAAGRKLVKSHDLIHIFAKSYGQQKFHAVHLPYSERYLADWFKYEDEDGRRYRKRYRRKADGESFYEKQYLDESKGVPASTVWSDIQQVYADPRAYKAGMTSEVTGYPTQKPLKLVERILAISSDPGDLVLDFFAGSGTTLVAAERMGRRWLGCDLGASALQLAARRLLGLPKPRPFALERIGAAGAPLEDPPTAVVEAKGDESRVRLEGRAETWDEQLERWSVGTLDGPCLATSWTAFRTLKNRTLPLVSEWLPTPKAKLAVEVIDVLGRTARIVPGK